jgi:hypothetical protein
VSEVVEHQSRQHQQVPGQADWQPAEMAHVGVECFSPGHRQHHRTQSEKGDHAIFQHEGHRVMGAESPQNMRCSGDVLDAKHSQRGEPDGHDGAEQYADPGRAMPLDHEQHGQDRYGQRDHHMVQLRCGNLEPFHRGQYGDGRRDHAVAVEQGGREDPEHADQRHDPGPSGCAASQQRQERQAAAFTLVVGAHDDDDVLDRHDEHHRPEDQRQHAQHM